MAGIGDLIATLDKHEGISRANRVRIELPGMGDRDLVDTTITTFNLPQRNLMTAEYMHDTQMKSYVYGSNNANITLNFKSTNSWELYKYFKNWTEVVLNSDSYTLAYKAMSFKNDDLGFGKTVRICPLNQLNEDVCEFRLYNAFPVSVGAIEMGNELENQVLSFSVELLYDIYTFHSLEPLVVP